MHSWGHLNLVWDLEVDTTAMVVAIGGRVLFEYGDVKHVSVIASARKSVLGMLYSKYVGNGTIDLAAVWRPRGVGFDPREAGKRDRHRTLFRFGVRAEKKPAGQERYATQSSQEHRAPPRSGNAPAYTPGSILEAALQGLLAQREKIEGQIAEVRRFLNGNRTNSSAATTEGTPGKRKKFSAASRRKMAEAQKRRWAEAKGKTETAESTAPIKQKRKMSAAGRKAISDATKKRWAAVRAAQAQPSKKVVAKKKATKVTKKSAGASATAA